MIDYEKLITIIIEAGAFISAMAAFVAAYIIFKVTKKFGTGILASGFKSIAVGIFILAIAILIDALLNYAASSGIKELFQFVTALTVAKLVLFVLGTYIIVIGSKKTGDKLEHVTK